MYLRGFGVEEMLQILKESKGLGKPRVRSPGSPIGSFTLWIPIYPIVGVWSWNRPGKTPARWHPGFMGRSRREPSHVDKRFVAHAAGKRNECSKVYGNNRSDRDSNALKTTARSAVYDSGSWNGRPIGKTRKIETFSMKGTLCSGGLGAPFILPDREYFSGF